MAIEYKRVKVHDKEMYKASAEHPRSGIYMSLYITWEEAQDEVKLAKFKETAKKEFKGFI